MHNIINNPLNIDQTEDDLISIFSNTSEENDVMNQTLINNFKNIEKKEVPSNYDKQN